MVHKACTLALLAALCAPSRAAEVPRGSELLRIDDVPGKLGSVPFRHGEHNRRYRRVDGTPIRCRDCHHTLTGDEPAASTPKADLRCTPCHPGLGQPARRIGGKEARAVAARKADGAVDYRSVLFHAYCRGCHRAQRGGERLLGGCKVCHERGIGSDAMHGRAEGER